MAFCRDCFSWQTLYHNSTCHSCGSPRVIEHNELKTLTIAHIDCDAFYASVEKRDDKTLVDKPLIIGGGSRGVVATACYIARIYGVHSAMPMFKALKACPHAKVIMPNMTKYSKVSKEIRRLMLETTPLVEPISIDEAFLDLTGTERLHQAPAAETLARLIYRIYNEVGITASVGLSYNKFLSKVASDLNKPEGFSIIGKSEAKSFLSPRPITTIWGVGSKLQNKLRKDGIVLIKDLQQKKETELVKKYGIIGSRLANFSIGTDERRVTAVSVVKSISTETTFNTNITGLDNLLPILWRLCETLSSRIKNKEKSGTTITVKFKTSNFKTFTRRKTLETPTQLAEILYQSSISILEKEAQKTYRLLGISLSDLKRSEDADTSDFLDLKFRKIKSIEKTIDNIREKLGDSIIEKGRGFKK
jgi:DNA polymerase-4